MNHLQKKAHIFQINISNGGVPKLARRAVEIGESGVLGDRQENMHVHGGPERALCLYSLERILALQVEGHPVFPGAMGENLTLAGVDWEQIKPGLCLALGNSLKIQLTSFTTPCNNLAPFFLEGKYGRVSQKQFPGWARLYARVIASGNLQVGDRIWVMDDSNLEASEKNN
jgi:MOSC domain-containing protein YiiM